MLAHWVVFGLPAVERDLAVGADDVVGVVRRLGKGEEARAGEALGRRLVFAELPVEVPLEERGDPVVVLKVRLEVTLDFWHFGRHDEGLIEEANGELAVFVGRWDETERNVKEGARLPGESQVRARPQGGPGSKL